MTAIEPAPIQTSEWQVIQQVASMLARSDMVPKAYRNHPENVILAALTGKSLGWDVTTAMRFVHVVEGKPTISAEGMVALVRRAGHSLSGESGDQQATVKGRRGDTGDEMSVTFTMAQARTAGLANKQVWKSYPSSMLWARAVSQLCRMLFPDVLLGASYTAEELGDGDDDDVEEPDPLAVAQNTLRDRIDALEDKDPLRAFCAEHGIPNRARDMTAEQVGQVDAFLDGPTDGIPDAEIVEDPTVETDVDGTEPF